MTKRKSRSSDRQGSKRAKVEDKPVLPKSEKDLYTYIIDQLSEFSDEGRDISQLFLRIPAKKHYPDYFNTIKRPISLHEIREKANKGSYESVDDFLSDVELMKNNAQTYNDPDSFVYHDAQKLYDYALEKVDEWKNEAINDYYQTVKATMLSVIDDLISYKKQGRQLSDLFMDVPSKKDYPDYYKIIKNPSSFNTLRSQVEEGAAKDMNKFLELASVIFSNARQYNEEGSLVYADAEALQKQLNSKVEKALKTLPAEPAGYANWANESGGTIKLKLKPSSSSTKVKLNLKGRQSTEEPEPKKDEAEDQVEEQEEEEEEEEEEQEQEQPEEDEEEEYKEEGEGEEMEEGEDDENRDGELADGDTGDEEQEEKEDPRKNVVDEVRHREEGKNENDALIKSMSISSVIPASSRYQQQRGIYPAPNVADMFQVVVPASRKLTVQSHAFSLPSYHHTININMNLHESLHGRHHSLSLVHNSRRVQPISSSSTNPWADQTKPIRNRFELRLVPGLNHIEVIATAVAPHSTARGAPVRQASAMPQSYAGELSGGELEKFTVWITLAK
uniref:ARAD1D41888p n=1 Tax=Blastobotrys adeninivorans TaxID=409370 RepID=A0A060TDA8_BLAAD